MTNIKCEMRSCIFCSPIHRHHIFGRDLYSFAMCSGFFSCLLSPLEETCKFYFPPMHGHMRIINFSSLSSLSAPWCAYWLGILDFSLSELSQWRQSSNISCIVNGNILVSFSKFQFVSRITIDFSIILNMSFNYFSCPVAVFKYCSSFNFLVCFGSDRGS